MRTLITCLIVSTLGLPLTACFVHTHDRRPARAYREERPRCHPSQYWDGYQCRQKGRGHGGPHR
jgi:hypothetical protein